MSALMLYAWYRICQVTQEDREGFDEILKSETTPGITPEDRTALVETDGRYSILKEDKKRMAFLLKVCDNKLIKKELKEGEFIL